MTLYQVFCFQLSKMHVNNTVNNFFYMLHENRTAKYGTMLIYGNIQKNVMYNQLKISKNKYFYPLTFIRMFSNNLNSTHLCYFFTDE